MQPETAGKVLDVKMTDVAATNARFWPDQHRLSRVYVHGVRKAGLPMRVMREVGCWTSPMPGRDDAGPVVLPPITTTTRRGFAAM
ncbi:MAG: hypothetical protein R2854_14925 [Caldilineaceae bacterium]